MSEKRGRGRPPKYSDIDRMREKIDAYFEECIAGDEPMTITGLSMALGLTRQGLLEYERKPEFSDTIKMAKTRVENYLEKALFGRNATGPIFNLKNNFGWEERVKNDNTLAVNRNFVFDDDDDAI
jgi:hypothetical protein